MKTKILLLATFLVLIPVLSFGLSNNGKVPVLTYHSHDVYSPCDYANNAILALEQDLETIRSQGFTVVPLYWIAEWAVGIRDGSTLPDKVVGISFDDGLDLDWIDFPSSECGYLKSFRRILQEFKAKYPDLPWYSPHASSFVIGSPIARSIIFPGFMNDHWWAEANASGIMEIYNHSADHDHQTIIGPIWEPALGVYLVCGGYGGDADACYSQGVWRGCGDNPPFGLPNFLRIDRYNEALCAVTKSAQYIHSKIYPAWPDLFAYPYGGASSYLRNTYFPIYQSQHQTLAAFGGEVSTTNRSLNYVTRSQNRWFLPRFIHRRTDGITGWSSTQQLIQILQGAP